MGALVKGAFGALQPVRDDDVAAKLARAAVAGVARAGRPAIASAACRCRRKTFDAPRFMRIDGALYLATGAGLILLSLVDLRDACARRAGRTRAHGRPAGGARAVDAGRVRPGTR